MRYFSSFLLAIFMGILSVPVIAECPDPEWSCEYWPPFLGLNCPILVNYCIGEECMEGARGNEIFVSPSDDKEDLLDGYEEYTNRWLVRHEGIMINISCGELLDHKHGRGTSA